MAHGCGRNARVHRNTDRRVNEAILFFLFYFLLLCFIILFEPTPLKLEPWMSECVHGVRACRHAGMQSNDIFSSKPLKANKTPSRFVLLVLEGVMNPLAQFGFTGWALLSLWINKFYC